MECRIIYEDDQVIVVHKPAGLPTQTAKVGQRDVVSELKNYLASGQKGKPPYLGVIHRLDQPVEGLLVFAKTKQAAADLATQLGKGILNKQYYALVCGQVSAQGAELVDYLIKTSEGKALVVTGEDKNAGAKRAVLQYRPLRCVAENPAVWLADIHIETGRFHQIRAQMSHAGMPLLGDMKYGTEISQEVSRKYGIRNVALCAGRLEYESPKTRKKLSFQIKEEECSFLKGKFCTG